MPTSLYGERSVERLFPDVSVAGLPSGAADSILTTVECLGRAGLSAARAAGVLRITPDRFNAVLDSDPAIRARFEQAAHIAVFHVLDNLRNAAAVNHPELAEMWFGLREEFA